MPHVFICYAREDKGFVRALAEGLTTAGREVWIDEATIQGGAEWMREIYRAIESADALLFVISPDSAASAMCALELAHAAAHHKKIVPILRRPTDPAAVPASAASLQWIAFGENDSFSQSLGRVTAAIDTDLEWVRRHTRLLGRALEWNGSGYDGSFVLRGRDLEDAVQWLTRQSAPAPALTPLQFEYIEASQKAEAEEVRRWKELYEHADMQRRTALARHLAAASRIEGGEAGNLVMRAALLAVEALRHHPTVEGDQALRRALRVLPRPIHELSHSEAIGFARFSPDDRYVAARTVSPHADVLVWDAWTLRALARLPHGEHLHGFAFSPDGGRIATCGSDGAVVVWETATGREIARLIHGKPVECVAFSPTGTVLAAGCADHTVAIWQIERRLRMTDLQHDDRLARVAFDRSGRYVASAAWSGEVKLWQIGRDRPLTRHRSQYAVYSLAFSPDGNTFATGGEDATAVVFAVPSGRIMREFQHPAPIWRVTFSPDNTRLATASKDSAVRIWSLETGAELLRLPQRHYDIQHVEFGPDGTRILTVDGDSAARVCDAASGEELLFLCYDHDTFSASFSHDGRQVVTTGDGGVLRTWEVCGFSDLVRLEPKTSAGAVAFSRDGRTLVAALAAGAIGVIEVPGGRVMARLQQPASVSAVAISPDGQYVAAANGDILSDRSARLWERGSWREVARMRHDSSIRALAFSPDGKSLMTASDGTVHLWSVPHGEEIRRFNNRFVVRDVAFSPDGRSIVTAPSDNVGRVWDVATGKPVAELRNVRDRAIFSPDGARVAGTCWDKTARVFDAHTGEELLRVQHEEDLRDLAFSPDGTRLATCSGGLHSYRDSRRTPGTVRDSTARVWDADGREIARMTHDYAVSAVAFSHDGRYVVSCGHDATARIWEAETGREVARIAGSGGIGSVAFSPDGTLLATGGSEGVRLSLWRAEDLLAEACRRVTRNLTLEEWRHYLPDDEFRKSCPNR